jgi:tRNA (guanine37-N1)-methyltransferase
MTFHILTIFPEFFQGPFGCGVVGKAIEAGSVRVEIHNLRDWTYDRHKTVDDRPFGGGEGMLMKPQPIFEAVESIWPQRRPRQEVVLLSAQGRLFDQNMARRLADECDELLLICGRYEGVDERVWESFSDIGHGERLLDCPQWTRPAEFRGMRVPEPLLSGHHEEIRKWRRKAAEEKTARMRPDLLQPKESEP